MSIYNQNDKLESDHAKDSLISVTLKRESLNTRFGFGIGLSNNNDILVCEVKPFTIAHGVVFEGQQIVKVNGTLVKCLDYDDIIVVIKSCRKIKLTLKKNSIELPYLPNEIIYQIASYLKSDTDIFNIAKVFPNLRFTLNYPKPYSKYISEYKDKYNVKKITFDLQFLVPLPEDITHIQFGRSFKGTINCKLPESIKSIKFGEYFNQPVDGLLPSKLEKLVFIEHFNQPVNNLPKGLKEISFGNYFNQPVNKLPPSLKKLNLGANFYHSIDNLPDSIEELNLMCHYDIAINKLPKNIITLCTLTRFNSRHRGSRELDYLKNLYPNLRLMYFYDIGYNRNVEITYD
jgi:hypothetical protein